MNVYAISPRGYCYGVVNAIKVAKEAREQYPNEDIYILGMIVHNKYIMQALNLLNIVTLDDSIKTRLELVDQIDNGIVILSAHGSAPEVKKRALDKGLIVFDATCQDVLKTYNLIKEYIKEGYEVIYYGQFNHPESNGACAIDPDKVHLVYGEDDIINLDISSDKIFMTNQTTLSIVDAKKIFAKAQEKYPNLIITEEICNATRIRQEAILGMPDNIELVYIVGDPKSNNSNKLASLASKKAKYKVVLIETVNDIDIEDLKNVENVAISSGASTPTYLTNMVIDYVKQFDKSNKNTHIKPEVDILKILD